MCEQGHILDGLYGLLAILTGRLGFGLGFGLGLGLELGLGLGLEFGFGARVRVRARVTGCGWRPMRGGLHPEAEARTRGQRRCGAAAASLGR